MKRTLILLMLLLVLLTGCASNAPKIPEINYEELLMVSDYDRAVAFTVPLNYKAVRGYEGLYAVVDENSFIIGYRAPVKNGDGYYWESVSLTEIFK